MDSNELAEEMRFYFPDPSAADPDVMAVAEAMIEFACGSDAMDGLGPLLLATVAVDAMRKRWNPQ